MLARGASAVPVVVVVVAAGVAAAVRGDLTDLFVYRYAGRAVLDGLDVYGTRDPVMGLPFTYPPFAAVVLVPLALVPQWLADALWTASSMAALGAVVVVVRRAQGLRAPGWLVAMIMAAALAMEPVWQNLTFGQVNLLLMLAVLVDVRASRTPWSGVLVGLAAGVKLEPLVFVVLLVLVGHRAAAIRARDSVSPRRSRSGSRCCRAPRRTTGPTARSTRAGSGRRSWPTTSRCTAQ